MTGVDYIPVRKVKDRWVQPALKDILFDRDQRALLTNHDFAQLVECDLPKKAYSGTLWRRQHEGYWFLCWYTADLKVEIRPIRID